MDGVECCHPRQSMHFLEVALLKSLPPNHSSHFSSHLFSCMADCGSLVVVGGIVSQISQHFLLGENVVNLSRGYHTMPCKINQYRIGRIIGRIIHACTLRRCPSTYRILDIWYWSLLRSVKVVVRTLWYLQLDRQVGRYRTARQIGPCGSQFSGGATRE